MHAELSHSMPEWLWGGLGYKVSPGVLRWDPSPEEQGWSLTRAEGNSGEERAAGPQVSWSGLRKAVGLAQPLRFQTPEVSEIGQKPDDQNRGPRAKQA